LLNEREQKLLARLSVFAGGFSIEVGEAVCIDDSIRAAAVLDLLGGLVDKSLVVCKKRHAAVRYSLLETIRRYASELLGDECHALRQRHALAFLGVARDAVPELMTGSVDRLDRLGVDRDNIRAALAWSVEHEPETIALPLAAAFRWYWYYRILWSEGLRWSTRVLDRTASTLGAERASLLTGAGTYAGYLGDVATGRRQLADAEAMWRTLGDERELALNLSAQAQLLATCGELEAAACCAEEALRLARKVGTTFDVGYCLTNAAAFVAQRRGEMEEADRYLEEAEAAWTDPPNDLGLPLVLSARALLALRRNDADAAARFARLALVAARDRRELWFSSRSLRILAITTEGDPIRAARLLGAADAMLSSIAAGMLLHERNEHERLLARLCETVSAEALEAAMLEGRRLCFEDACELALAEVQAKAGLLHVSDLGPLRIMLDGKPLEFEGRSSGRARELLVYLLAYPEGRRREEVGLAFWPDASTDQVKNSFHVTLHRLRKMLGSADAVSGDGGRYRIDPKFLHRVDSKRFEQELTAALRNGTAASIEAALSLYQGDFLQGEDAGEWCLEIRKQLRQLHLRGLFALGQSFEAQRRYADAADTYAQLVAREPFHEAGSRQLMICRARLGARTDALLVYRDLEQRLRDDLAAAPEPETRSLYRRLQQNEAV
jgi:DNA-binding SARP family transcriptional activator